VIKDKVTELLDVEEFVSTFATETNRAAA